MIAYWILMPKIRPFRMHNFETRKDIMAREAHGWSGNTRKLVLKRAWQILSLKICSWHFDNQLRGPKTNLSVRNRAVGMLEEEEKDWSAVRNNSLLEKLKDSPMKTEKGEWKHTSPLRWSIAASSCPYKVPQHPGVCFGLITLSVQVANSHTFTCAIVLLSLVITHSNLQPWGNSIKDTSHKLEINFYHLHFKILLFHGFLGLSFFFQFTVSSKHY